MEYSKGTPVVTADGSAAGRLAKIVVDPVTDEVTHLVVEKGVVRKQTRVVPIDRVKSATSGEICLQVEADHLDELPTFEEDCYVMLDDEEMERTGMGAGTDLNRAPALYGYWPVSGGGAGPLPGTAPARFVADTCTNVPSGAAVLSEGTVVVGADDRELGRIERVISQDDDPEGRVSHFVISQGTVRKKRRLVPIEWVERIEDRKVRLAVGSRTVEERVRDFSE